MDVRSPIFQNIACVLMGVMFLNPIVGTAADLALDAAAGGNANIGSANNGVPMVNIATPNGSGLSHNKFTDYNVGQQGLILNNSNQNMVNTQLGGYVVGNPNLKGGTASVILNEVNGGSPSQLKGYTEVAGRSAHVIVANPHGITCDGCGFLNTPRATLTTGTPVVENGRLDRYDVDGGEIAIEGEGLNARNVDQFELITRSAKINAELHAQKLAMITGRNEVDAADLSATAKATNGSTAPQLAIDSSALGGMYAGAIRLVGTEQGVGVKLAGDMAASGGDIHIDANGQLSLARTAASGDVTLRAEQIELNDDTYAGRNATLQADRVDVRESLAAGNRVQVDSDQLSNAGIIEAGVRADGSLNSAGHLQLNGGQVDNLGSITSHGSLATNVQTLNNQGGTLTAANDATLKADALNNHNGQVLAQRDLTIQADASDNRTGELLAGRDLSVSGVSLNNQSGTLAANGSIKTDLSAALNNTSGLVEAGTHLDISAGSLSNDSGRLRALGNSGSSRFVIGARFDNDNGKVEIGNAELNLTSASLSNQGGLVRHLGTQGFNLSLADLGNAGGSFITNGDLTLDADDWSNSSVFQANRLNLRFGTFQQTATGKLLSIEDIVARGDTWQNDGSIETDGDLDLLLSGAYSGDGKLLAQGDLRITAASGDLGVNAEWRSGGAANFTLGGTLLSRGVITAGTTLAAQLAALDNRGTLGAASTLRVDAPSLRNEGGLIFSGDNMWLLADAFTNLYGDIYSLGELWIAKDMAGSEASLLENRSGSIESSGDMSLRAAVLINRKELFTAGRTQTYGYIDVICYDCGGDHHNVDYVATERFTITVEQDSAAARIHSGGDLVIEGGSVANHYSNLSASGNIDIDSVSLENMGAASGTIERVRRFSSGRITDGTSKAYRNNYVTPYNASGFPKEVSSAFYNFSLASDIETVTPTAPLAPAIIQAGGNVNISATQTIDNASVLEHQAPQYGTVPAVDTQVASGNQPMVVQLNAQLPADLTQQLADPLALPGFSLPQGQNGLFSLNLNPDHPYLIETNPAFASLKGFLNSDYMLGLLGYDIDLMQKRLGDGLYEQRLIQQAIVARTGKRFLDGLASDEAQYKYLMDNAIASKEALSLSVGVALSAEQVAALTHDIVWMEEREVNGVKVLAPVLYLAQANDRLAPSGALIQGRDVALISGSDLQNSGTLRARVNLDVDAKNISNSGLMQANQRLQLLAEDSIRNAQGGIINGKNVTLFTDNGDITNERTISQDSRSGQGFSQLTSVVDNTARIEAGNDLLISAGRDIQNIGGALSAGRHAELEAGNDVIIGSAEAESGQMRKDKRHFWSSSTTTQYGSDVQVGGDLQVAAGRNLDVVASKIKAGGDIDLYAGGDVTVAAAANESSSEYHYKRSGKKVDQENSQVRQQASVIEAGRNISIGAGQDLTLVASQIRGDKDVALNAGRDVQILSAQDESDSYYYKKSKGSFGRSKSVEQARYDSTNVASVVEAGSDLSINTSKAADGSLSLEGGRDVVVMGSTLKAGNDVLVGGLGDVSVLSGQEEHSSFYEKKKSGSFGLSKSGKSQTNTSSSQIASELAAGNDVVVLAGNNVNFLASQVNAGNDAELRAGLVTGTGDINLAAANDAAYSRAEAYKKKVGLSGGDFAGLMLGSPSWGGDITLAASKKSGSETQSSTNVGSQITAGRDTTLIAERDINVIGSGVGAGRNALLDAERDVNIVAGASSQQTTSWKNTKTVGMQQDMDDNGYTTFVGEEKLKKKYLAAQQTAAGSLIDAGLDIDIRAGRDIVQKGSDLDAGYDLNLQAGRNIVIDGANERSVTATSKSQERDGSTTKVNHNFGNLKDALNGAGKGDNAVSQASSILKAADTINQFFGGPTGDMHAGKSSQSQSVTQTVESKRPSTLSAGNDISLQANEGVVVRGGQFDAGRDINVKAKDVTFDVAKGILSDDSQQTQGKGGVLGGTTGGIKVGVGTSRGVASQQRHQGTASAAYLAAERDINLEAAHDLSLIGTHAQSGRDINLKAGNDLLVGATGNSVDVDERRRSAGGEVGVTVGSEGFGVYVSASLGRGKLEREGIQQQEAYLYAGRDLNFKSGQDTTIAGAQLEGESIHGQVGRNLNVSSVSDSGKVQGKEYDVSATVTIGYGMSVSGSAGYGETSGKTNWVGRQTSIIARDKLDVRAQEHTQIDGALIASRTDNLKLDTGTLGFRDIKGEDKEHGYYLNAGGSWGKGPQDSSQVGKGDKGGSGWSLEGYEYSKEREQIVRATVGAGEIIVRNDAETESDSTVGLNRDINRAYEITKDKEERTDLYVSKSSLEMISDPVATLERWQRDIEENPQKVLDTVKQAHQLVEGIGNAAEQAWREIQAFQISAKDVPSNLSKVFSEEQALDITRNMVRNGLSPEMAAKLDERDLQALSWFVDKVKDFDLSMAECQASGSCKVTGNFFPPGSGGVDENGVKEIVINSGRPRTSGENLLLELVKLQKYVSVLPVEEAQLVMFAAQALMGPAKAAVGLAGNQILANIFGSQIESAKERIAAIIADPLVPYSDKELLISHLQYKEDFENGRSDSNGNDYVVGAKFLLDIALGSVGGIGKKPVSSKKDVSVGGGSEVSGLLPKPGTTSVPASGVGAGATFKSESTKQLGKKLGKHVKDFGGDPANPTDRKMVFDKIQDIGNNPEKVIPGKFSGQGPEGLIGSVFFRIKGNDVVVTKPDGSFVTILKDGVTGNTFVKNALKGE